MGGSMFFISRDKKIALMFIGCMTLSLLRMDIPLFNTAKFLLVGSFLLSEFNNWKAMMIRWTNSPVGRIMLIVLLSVLLCILFSPHLHAINNARGFLQDELLLKYFALGYAFFSIRNENNLKTLIQYSIIPMFVLTLFGVVNLLDHRSFFVTEMMSNWSSSSFSSVNELAGDKFMDADRFRVQAMFSNPFDYGYICSLCLIIYIYGYIKKMISKYLFSILSLCCSFGILLCGCRTVIFCSILGVCTIILFSYKLGKSMTSSLVAVSIAVVAYMTVPVVNENVNAMTTIFSDRSGREYGGSSIEMRSIQFATVLSLIQESPAFGRGVHFFNLDMGWKDGGRGLKDQRLFGLEGVYLSYLLERGLVGYLLYLYVWIFLLIYLYKRRHFSRELAAFGISVWVLYTAFANMTGELLSVYPTLIIIGSVLGAFINNEKSKNVK